MAWRDRSVRLLDTNILFTGIRKWLSAITALAQGDLLYASSSTALAVLAKDANATRSLTNTGTNNNPAWAQVNLANGVTGDLPYANLAQASAASKLLGRGSASGAGDWEEITVGTNLTMSGTTLSASGGSSAWTSTFKSADTTRSNDETPSADPDLVVAMSANTTYVIRMNVHFTSTTASDFDFGFSGPASPTRVSYKVSYIPPGSVTQTNQTEEAYDASTIVACATGEVGWLELQALIDNGANTGNFAFIWSQNIATADAGAVVLKGSYIEYKEIA